MVGGDFNWSTATGGPRGEYFTVKTFQATTRLLLLIIDSCLNKQHSDTHNSQLLQKGGKDSNRSTPDHLHTQKEV